MRANMSHGIGEGFDDDTPVTRTDKRGAVAFAPVKIKGPMPVAFPPVDANRVAHGKSGLDGLGARFHCHAVRATDPAAGQM